METPHLRFQYTCKEQPQQVIIRCSRPYQMSWAWRSICSRLVFKDRVLELSDYFRKPLMSKRSIKVHLIRSHSAQKLKVSMFVLMMKALSIHTNWKVNTLLSQI